MAGFDADAGEQDAFFGARRVVGDPAPVFVAAVLRATFDVLADITRHGTGLDTGVRDDLVRGAWAVFGDSPPPAATLAAVPEGTEGMGAAAALCRWRRGHRLFFTLTQGILVGLGALDIATARDDRSGRATALRLTSAMVWCAAAALRFTADFPPALYSSHVRPAMMPPHVGEGFSGSSGRDHQVLVRAFRAMGPILPARAESDLPVAVAAMLAAHTGVCSRFGGKEHPSLLMAAHHRAGDTRSGVQVVEEIGRRRLALVTRPAADTPLRP